MYRVQGFTATSGRDGLLSNRHYDRNRGDPELEQNVYRHSRYPLCGFHLCWAVGGEDGQLGTGRRLHPPDGEPHRRGDGRGLEGGVELVSEVEALHDKGSKRGLAGRIIVTDSSLTEL